MGYTSVATAEERRGKWDMSLGMVSGLRSAEYERRARAMRVLLATVALVGEDRRMFEIDSFVADLSGIPLGDVGTARRLSYTGPRELYFDRGDRVNQDNAKAVEASLAETIQLNKEVTITREELAEDVEAQLSIEALQQALADKQQARFRQSEAS